MGALLVLQPQGAHRLVVHRGQQELLVRTLQTHTLLVPQGVGEELGHLELMGHPELPEFLELAEPAEQLSVW